MKSKWYGKTFPMPQKFAASYRVNCQSEIWDRAYTENSGIPTPNDEHSWIKPYECELKVEVSMVRMVCAAPVVSRYRWKLARHQWWNFRLWRKHSQIWTIEMVIVYSLYDTCTVSIRTGLCNRDYKVFQKLLILRKFFCLQIITVCPTTGNYCQIIITVCLLDQ